MPASFFMNVQPAKQGLNLCRVIVVFIAVMAQLFVRLCKTGNPVALKLSTQFLYYNTTPIICIPFPPIALTVIGLPLEDTVITFSPAFRGIRT